jgi:phage tail-like protein
MAGETQDQSIGPLPKFYFSVDIGDQQNLTFQEVSGLDAQTQVIEYRAGDNKRFSTVTMPGIGKFSNVTLKKGVFVRDDKFWDWYSQIKMNTIKRVPVVIRLLDEKGNASMVWTLLNAWPTKITGADLKSDGNEVAVETLEIAHEGMTIKTG